MSPSVLLQWHPEKVREKDSFQAPSQSGSASSPLFTFSLSLSWIPRSEFTYRWLNMIRSCKLQSKSCHHHETFKSTLFGSGKQDRRLAYQELLCQPRPYSLLDEWFPIPNPKWRLKTDVCRLLSGQFQSSNHNSIASPYPLRKCKTWLWTQLWFFFFWNIHKTTAPTLFCFVCFLNFDVIERSEEVPVA